MGHKRISKSYTHLHSNHMYIRDDRRSLHVSDKVKALTLRINPKYYKKFKKALEYRRLRNSIIKILYGNQNNILPLPKGVSIIKAKPNS